MRARWGPLLVVGAGSLLAVGVNVAAAIAPPSGPAGRMPLVDPFAVTAPAAVPADGSGAAAWAAARSVAPAAPRVPTDDEHAPVSGSPEAVSALADEVAQVPAPLVHVPQSRDQWVSSSAAATGIPARAVLAYGNATLAIDVEDPGCRLGWPTLAGIGGVESGHGTHGGATLRDDGRTTIPIVGPALDGSPGRAAISAGADSAAWHGDPVWDHAVGPMQFIPSTWRRWAADGDGDGVADPQDIDDAALAAARYLCAGSRDLSTWDGWHAAVLSYNHSEAYAEQVFRWASGYAAQVAG